MKIKKSTGILLLAFLYSVSSLALESSTKNLEEFKMKAPKLNKVEIKEKIKEKSNDLVKEYKKIIKKEDEDKNLKEFINKSLEETGKDEIKVAEAEGKIETEVSDKPLTKVVDLDEVDKVNKSDVELNPVVDKIDEKELENFLADKKDEIKKEIKEDKKEEVIVKDLGKEEIKKEKVVEEESEVLPQVSVSEEKVVEKLEEDLVLIPNVDEKEVENFIADKEEVIKEEKEAEKKLEKETEIETEKDYAELEAKINQIEILLKEVKDELYSKKTKSRVQKVKEVVKETKIVDKLVDAVKIKPEEKQLISKKFNELKDKFPKNLEEGIGNLLKTDTEIKK